MKTIETKKTMKTKKINLKEQGITLVALVVTIIILLILAGVTINIALRENGLFKMARTGVNKYEQSAINEQTEIENVVESLKELAAIDGEEINRNPKKYYGEYVKYGIDLDGDGKFTSDWRLFYVGDSEDGIANGRIFLIAADYVPTGNPILSEAMVKVKMEPVNSYAAYWDRYPAYTYQDVSELDPNPIQLFMHTGYDLNQNEWNNTRCTLALLNTTNWAGFAEETYGNSAIGGPTLEMWCKAWNKVVDTNDTTYNLKKLYASGNNAKDGYYIGLTRDGKDFTQLVYMNGTNVMGNGRGLRRDYPAFFPPSGVGYWLSSPSAYLDRFLWMVSSDGSLDHSVDIRFDDWNSKQGCGLRPIVCLESGVKLQKNEAESTAEKTIYDIVK